MAYNEPKGDKEIIMLKVLLHVGLVFMTGGAWLVVLVVMALLKNLNK